MLLSLLIALMAGAAVLLLVWGVFGGRRRSPHERLQDIARMSAQVASAGASATGERSRRSGERSSRPFSGLDRVVERRDWGANIARELARADLALRPTEYLAIRTASLLGIPLAAVVLGATVLPGLGNPVAWLVAALIGFWLPRFWLGRRKSGRLKAFNSRLADTITLLANSLRSGSSFLQGVELVVRESQPPISTEFERVIREINLGLPFDQALGNLGRRVRSDDLDLMITAINIQHQVGGNLAEILDSIAFTIRERVRIKGEIRTLTAQQRMSGYVVGGLPIAIMAILNVISPRFFEPMFQSPPSFVGFPMGMVLLALGAFSMAVGFALIRRIVDIQV